MKNNNRMQHVYEENYYITDEENCVDHLTHNLIAMIKLSRRKVRNTCITTWLALPLAKKLLEFLLKVASIISVSEKKAMRLCLTLIVEKLLLIMLKVKIATFDNCTMFVKMALLAYIGNTIVTLDYWEERQKRQNSVNTEGGKIQSLKGIEPPRLLRTKMVWKQR